MSTLWVSIEPGSDETRLMVTSARTDAALRARLPPVPRQPQALTLLLQGLSAWFGEPLTAVVAADREDVLVHPERWAQLLGEIDSEQARIEWVVVPPVERDRFLGELGDFKSAKRLIVFTATGLR
jgi:hypothetical protein